MTDNSDAKRWRDFKFTVDVVLAAALAREDLAEFRAADTASFGALHFKLLAASTSEQPRLPAEPWSDVSQMVSASLEESAGDLRMTFQAIGYAAMTYVAGKGARIVSADGEIEVAFRFDAGGRGIAVLADNAAVRRALADFSIVLE
jgi:hypothetical protein